MCVLIPSKFQIDNMADYRRFDGRPDGSMRDRSHGALLIRSVVVINLSSLVLYIYYIEYDKTRSILRLIHFIWFYPCRKNNLTSEVVFSDPCIYLYIEFCLLFLTHILKVTGTSIKLLPKCATVPVLSNFTVTVCE